MWAMSLVKHLFVKNIVFQSFSGFWQKLIVVKRNIFKFIINII